MSVRLAGLVALFSVLLSCGVEDRQIVIALHNEVDEDASRLEVILFRASSAISCSDLLGEETIDFPDALSQVAFPREAPVPLGQLGEGRYLLLTRAWSQDCRVALECQEFEVARGVEEDIQVGLTDFLSLSSSCPESYRCGESQCVFCNECCFDWECNDNTPETTDVCIVGECSVSTDHDDDSISLPHDCDDRREEVFPGATPTCGHALDHDCDGVIDDLEGCSTQECWLGNYNETDRRADIRAKSVVSFGAFVVASIDDDLEGTSLWIGSLDGGRLVEVGFIHLEGTFNYRSKGLAIYGTTAFVATTDNSLHIVDISVPGSPQQLEEVPLVGVTTTLSVIPPLLWIPGSLGVSVFDISQVGPSDVWPDLLNSISPDNLGYYTQVFARNGMAYLTAQGPTIRCAPLDSAVHVPDGEEDFPICISVAAHSTYPEADFRFGQVTAAGELFLVSNFTGIEEITTPSLLWQFSLEEDGTPAPTEVRVGEVPVYSSGDQVNTTHLLVAGGSIFRSTNRGLYIHSKEDFSLSSHFDATDAPNVLETALLGTTAVLAAGNDGMIVLSLSCR